MAIFATGCIKQKDCGCGLTGKLIYLNKQEEIYCGNPTKISALFISNYSENLQDGYLDSTSYANSYYIVGNIPNKFRKDTDNIAVCLKEIEKRYCLGHGLSTVYELICVEKVK